MGRHDILFLDFGKSYVYTHENSMDWLNARPEENAINRASLMGVPITSVLSPKKDYGIHQWALRSTN